jgi:hypothetical protein
LLVLEGGEDTGGPVRRQGHCTGANRSGARRPESPKASDDSEPRRPHDEGMNYQTIQLSGGRHRSVEQGACDMELASLLAGESFSDHPQSACPVISSFLRAYNDRVNDERRQDLYRYAAEVVDTRSPRIVEQARADRLQAWTREMWARRWTRRFAPPAWRMVGIEQQPPHDVLGVHAVRAIWKVDDLTHAAALALIDALLAIRNDVSDPPPPTTCETYSVA